VPHLTPIDYKTFHKFLIYIGCTFIRKHGSHCIYTRSDLKRPIVVPERKEIPTFVILNNLRLLNIPKEKYLKILEEI